MNFISPLYGVFLVSVLGIYWNVPDRQLKLWTLLLASLVFYSSLNIQYLPLLLVLTFLNYRLGLELGQSKYLEKISQNANNSSEEWQLAQSDWNQRKLKILCLGIFINVFILLGFKYFNPLLTLVLNLSDEPQGNFFKFVAPLGISFFTFECIAYLIDVYRGAPATRQFLKFAAYKLFFAKLISGPITRYHHLATQLQNQQIPSVDRCSEALWLIARGAIKKGIFADNLGIFVDLCFGNLQRAGSLDLWLAIIAYGLQLYLDFNGYVDIARGSALLFGLVLPENFDFPYFSTSIADFWRHWHMTLGDWLRNYLYFPLGGSRKGLIRTCINLLIVMLIAGIWHGSAWGFVVWGGIHGLALIVHRLTKTVSDRSPIVAGFWRNPIGIIFAWFITQLMVFTAWIWFRLPNIQDSTLVIQHLWGRNADAQFAQKVYVEALNLSQPQMCWLLLAIAVVMLVTYIFKKGLKVEFSWPIKLVFVPLCFYAVWLFAPEGGLPYIYFDF
ncbi:membrane bound O-acyl transferase, MBOAT family protein [Richelia sinica FACHB-800]|uniref:Membrane bound O-acyl transferase, MBOAT family protein n=1 Tax=Richelia sinica FACHB-800 TaxID=1357546 RepID=A0A975Y5F2_9NOST|nr:MBOAT family protein [Richelia sinica]QXE24163.1 membrane bound O-acyl transferase, MBOAT family protein [Richelia sinica FACHB-800]